MTFKQVAVSPWTGVKALSRIIFQRPSYYRWFTDPYSTASNYRKEVGDGTGSSTVMAPLQWIAKTFPEAPPALWRANAEGQEIQVRKHPLLTLLRRPNPFVTGPILWMATLMDWNIDGNAYWLKRRDQAGVVRELWWVPHWMIGPEGDEGEFITSYVYRPGGEEVRYRPSEIVHFRFGMDSDNPRLGYSPLKSVLSEVFTDDEAARFTASLLKNMGVPGLVVSPAAGISISEEQALATKATLMQNLSGDNRGDPIVMTGSTEIHQFGFSPEQLVLREMRRIPEERVTAVLGIPAIVAGLGAGLDRSTFTNMGEAKESAYESGIIPSQRILAEEVRYQLLSEFESPTRLDAMRFGFDLSEVRVLQPDEDALLRRYDVGYRGGFVLRSEVRRAIGLPVTDDDNVFLVPSNTAAVSRDNEDVTPMTGPPPEPPAALPPAEQPLALALARFDSLELERKQDVRDLRAVISEWQPPEVKLPDIHMPITFEQGSFQFDAPDVTVEPAQITVKADLAKGERTITVERDEDGNAVSYHEVEMNGRVK